MDAPTPPTGPASTLRPLLVFNHIPKCAGTAITGALQAALSPVRPVYYLDRALVGGYDDFSQLDPVARSRFVFSPEELPDADYVHGHITPGTTMARYPDAPHVTILRNPHSRVISQWVHGRSLTDLDLRHWGPAYAFRIARRPLGEYLRHEMIAPNIDNTITRFLTWPHAALQPTAFIAEADDEVLVETAVKTLDSFLHVDVVENRAFLERLGEKLGVTVAGGRLNDRSAHPPVVPTDLAGELDEETRALLDHRTRLDRRVWAHVVEQVMPGADADQLLADGLADSVRRYRELPARKPQGSLVRRTAERAFALKARLDPRLRGFR
ncbi:MAG: hypothetical protein J7518_09910 [Nocardioidaceae bacterium]|nr:hypothetical protein [Nocardioidaceae bacterium]